MIPQELINRDMWVTHQRKIPVDPKTGGPASSTDPSTWSAFTQAKTFVEEGRADGLGFVLHPPYLGVDLDHCIDPVSGQMTDFAKEIIRKCNSYTEYSPSGTGVHIFLKGHLPRAYKRPGLEIYQTGRYFTVTGKPVLPLREIREVDFESLNIIPRSEEIAVKPANWISEKLASVRNGERNSVFTEIAGSLRARGYSVEDMFALLQPRAREVEFDEGELRRVCESVGRYAPNVAPVDDEGAEDIVDFMAQREYFKFIVDRLIPENGIVIIAGIQGSRKSWLLLDLAIAFSTGSLWLNKYSAQKKKVLLIDLEREKAIMQERLEKLTIARGITVRDLKGQLFPKITKRFKINNDASFAAFERLIAAQKPEVVLIDSLKTLVSCDVSNNQEMMGVFEKLKQLRSKYGVTFVILHHENKGSYERKREGREVTAENIAGASAINEVPEGLFVVVEHDSDASFIHHVKNTAGPKIAPVLVSVKDTRNGVCVEAI